MAASGAALSGRQGRDRLTLADKAESRRESVWPVLDWVGLAFLLMGLVDLALAWFPLGFGNPEWEFGTISATLNGLPLLTIGLVSLVVSGAMLGRRWQVRTVASTMLVLAVLLAASAVLYTTVLPIALRQGGAGNPLVLAGLQKAGVKAGALFVIYIALFVRIGIMGFRFSSAR
jgi:hypothetical protein